MPLMHNNWNLTDAKSNCKLKQLQMHYQNLLAFFFQTEQILLNTKLIHIALSYTIVKLDVFETIPSDHLLCRRWK